MKIAFIASNSGKNGANLSLIKLASLLKKDSKEVVIIYPSKGPIQEICANENIKYKNIYGINWVYKLDKSKRIKYLIKFLLMKLVNVFSELRIYFYFKKEKMDIVHINTLSIGRGAKAAIRLKIPLVWHIREFMEEDLSHSIYQKKKSMNLIKKSDAIIAVSNSVKDKYEKILDRSIFSIYNGIDVSKFYKPDRSIFANNNIKYAIIGSINENKGHTFLIDCFSTCIENGYSNIFLSIYGEGEKNYILDLKKIIKGKNIQFCGYRNDIQNILSETDVLFVTSKQEAFGRVTVEGQLSGCLIIGINSGGTAELLSDGQGLLSSMKKENFIRCIEKSINNIDECRNIAKKGQNFSLKLSAENNKNEITKIYEQILNYQGESK